MPVSKLFREPPPFAPIFHDIQNGIEHFKVVVGDITSMDRETIRYTFVLHLADLHHATILTYLEPLDNILSEHTLKSLYPTQRETSPPPGRFALSISGIRGCSGLRVAAALPFALPSSKSISMKHKNDVFLSYQGCRAVSRGETRSFF